MGKKFSIPCMTLFPHLNLKCGVCARHTMTQFQQTRFYSSKCHPIIPVAIQLFFYYSMSWKINSTAFTHPYINVQKYLYYTQFQFAEA
jgi:hypothetical protein